MIVTEEALAKMQNRKEIEEDEVIKGLTQKALEQITRRIEVLTKTHGKAFSDLSLKEQTDWAIKLHGAERNILSVWKLKADIFFKVAIGLGWLIATIAGAYKAIFG